MDINLSKLNINNEIDITGIYTHFSKAIDEKWTNIQFKRFERVINNVKEIKSNILCHCSNSTAFLKYPEMNLDAVRLRFLYTR